MLPFFCFLAQAALGGRRRPIVFAAAVDEAETHSEAASSSEASSPLQGSSAAAAVDASSRLQGRSKWVIDENEVSKIRGGLD
jgi:hypothetical protein